MPFTASLKPILKRLLRRNQRIIDGFPEGLEPDLVDKLCRKHRDAPLKKASYQHLSAWKATGSYRILLETQAGEPWNLIFKQANYNLQHIPALNNLPIQPGFPEFLIYKNACSPLASYLPRIYQCEEAVPNECYHYLFEDLGDHYRLAKGAVDLIRCARMLPALHSALADFCEAADTHELLCYDDSFWNAFNEYGIKALRKYQRVTESVAIDELCEIWPKLSALRDRILPHHSEFAPIHGDFNVSNILIHKHHPDSIKVIDWEWTGIGIRHADLAALLKGEQEAIESQVVKEFARHDESLSLSEHWYLYQWCQIERGMLDAAFLSAQEMNAEHTAKLNLRWCVDNSAKIVLSKFSKLQQTI